MLSLTRAVILDEALSHTLVRLGSKRKQNSPSQLAKESFMICESRYGTIYPGPHHDEGVGAPKSFTSAFDFRRSSAGKNKDTYCTGPTEPNDR